MSNLYPGDKVSPAEAGRLLDEQARAIVQRVRDTGRRCPSCGEYEGHPIEVACLDEDGERMTFTVCRNCDYGINEHTEGECGCHA